MVAFCTEFSFETIFAKKIDKRNHSILIDLQKATLYVPDKKTTNIDVFSYHIRRTRPKILCYYVTITNVPQSTLNKEAKNTKK